MMFLDAQQPDLLQDYLREHGWIDVDEAIISTEKPGEGNMNYTLRVTAGPAGHPARTLIVKQSRDYVEKYPSIPAPVNRAVIEGRFYQTVRPNPDLAGAMPQLLGLDEENNILVLEDLGASRDYTLLYQPGQILSEADALTITAYLSALHAFSPPPDPLLANRAMRSLNHEHIFIYPFLEENGIDLNTIQPGLRALAMPYKRDTDLKNLVRELGDTYLSDGNILLHGDYYPGSWLRTASGTKVIDPEFCFYGLAEFDLGILIAHLMMAQQPESILTIVLANYETTVGFDELVQKRFTGVEIMRRLIGLAQLPLSLSLDEKAELLRKARVLLG